jgi:purine-binding chemotaxis protein CheW
MKPGGHVSGTGDGQALVFRAGPHICAIGLERVAEVLRPLPTTPFAGAPPFVRGVSVVRGAAVPVIAVAALLEGHTPGTPGIPDTPAERPPSGAARFVSVRADPRPMALDVDAVIGVRDLPLDLLPDVSSVFGAGVRDAVAAIGALDEQPVVFLAATRRVPDSVWDTLESAVTT